jgi:antitoxin CptB
MIGSAEHSRILWRCRRGIRELDLMLMKWAATAWDGASPELRAQFARLLELPDPELERYLIWGGRPDDPGLSVITESIREIMSSGERTFLRSARSKYDGFVV